MRIRWPKQKDIYGEQITNIFFENGMIQTYFNDKKGGWILKNRQWSPYYIQCRPMTSKKISQKLLNLVGNALADLLEEETEGITKVIGGSLTGIPMATSITLSSGIPSCNVRLIPNIKTVEQFKKAVADGKFEKEEYGEYGDYSLTVGDIEDGDKLAIVDDIATDFGTKKIILEQINYVAKMKGINMDCKDVIVLFDREQGSKEAAHKLGINLYSLIPFKTKGIHWLQKNLNPDEYNIIIDYLNRPNEYQNTEMREKIMSRQLFP